MPSFIDKPSSKHQTNYMMPKESQQKNESCPSLPVEKKGVHQWANSPSNSPPMSQKNALKKWKPSPLEVSSSSSPTEIFSTPDPWQLHPRLSAWTHDHYQCLEREGDLPSSPKKVNGLSYQKKHGDRFPMDVLEGVTYFNLRHGASRWQLYQKPSLI